MQLRHIRPRSVEWYDAVEHDEAEGRDHLTPEQTLRVRTLVAMEAESDRSRAAVAAAPVS